MYPERWNFTSMRPSNTCSESWNCWKWFSHKIVYSIFPIILTPEYSKFDPNIIGLYIKFPILLKPKNYVYMSVVTWLCVPSKKHWIEAFFGRMCKKLYKTFIKKFYGFLGTAASCISLLKSKRSPSSVPFIVIKMV